MLPLGAAEVFARVAGLLRGPHHLADKALRRLGAFVAVLDAPWPDAQVVVGVVIAGAAAQFRGDGARDIEMVAVIGESASSGVLVTLVNSSILPTTCAAPTAGLFSCRPLVGFLGCLLATFKPAPKPSTA